MPKPYDASMKYLLERHPVDWLRFLGIPVATVEVIDADLSTVTASADKVLRITAEPPTIVHIEFQSGYDERLDKRMLRYNVLLDYDRDEAVESAVILLSPAAERRRLTGRVVRKNRLGSLILDFTYRVERIWEHDIESILAGPIGILPLAPLSNVSTEMLPDVIRKMDERFANETSPADAAELWTGTYVLMGLRYTQLLTRDLLKGVRRMKESVTYQEIIAEGEARGEVRGEARGEARGRLAEGRNLVLRLGRKRFGEPNSAIITTLEAIASVERIEQLAEQIIEAESWNELDLANEK